MSIGAVQSLAANIAELSGSISFDFNALFDSLTDAVMLLDWSEPSQAINTILSREWLNATFNDCIYSLLPGAENYAGQLTEEINTAISKMAAGFSGFVSFSVLGLVGGFFLTRFLVKRTIAKRSWWRSFLSALYDLIIAFALTCGMVWLEKVWAPSVFITSILSVTVFGALTLLRSYLLYGRKIIKVEKIVNVKNIVILMIVRNIKLTSNCLLEFEWLDGSMTEYKLPRYAPAKGILDNDLG